MDSDYATWMERHAPAICTEHFGGGRLGWSTIRGCYGFVYRCGCFWGSDDGRGEGWSRRIDSDVRAAVERAHDEGALVLSADLSQRLWDWSQNSDVNYWELEALGELVSKLKRWHIEDSPIPF